MIREDLEKELFQGVKTSGQEVSKEIDGNQDKIHKTLESINTEIKEENFKILKLLHIKVGKKIEEQDSLLESIYSSNFDYKGIKSFILDKYDLEGEELLKLLYLLFPYQEANIVEKFQELEKLYPNIFGFKKLNENYEINSYGVYDVNIRNLLSIIRKVKNSRIKKVFKKFDIKTNDDFKKLEKCRNLNVLVYGLDKNFDYILSLSSNIDEYDSISSDKFTFSTSDINSKDFSFLKQFSINIQKEIMSKVSYEELEKIFNLEEEVLLQEIDAKYIKDALLNLDIFGEFIKIYLENKNEIDNYKQGGDFGMFSYLVKNELYDNLENYFITKDNFLDYLEDDEVFINFYKQDDIKGKGIRPWTKKWFLEKPERKDYLESNYIKIFKKYGLILGSKNGLIENFLEDNTEQWDKLYDFINKNLINSREKTRIFNNTFKGGLFHGFHDFFNKIFDYYLENKQKSIIPMMQKMDFIMKYWLFDFTKIKFIDDFKDETGNINYKKLRRSFRGILKQNNDKKIEKKLRQFDNIEKWNLIFLKDIENNGNNEKILKN